MQNPIREQIPLDGRWQTRPVDAQAVSVFVPGSWSGKQVVLQPASGQHRADAQVAPGQWNTVRTAGTDIAGARLVASHPLHITALEANAANRRSLAVRVRLAGEESAAGLLTIVLSLTDTSGKLVGGTELLIAAKTRDLSVELPLPTPHSTYRLKASLCAGERVVDNARIDLHL